MYNNIIHYLSNILRKVVVSKAKKFIEVNLYIIRSYIPDQVFRNINPGDTFKRIGLHRNFQVGVKIASL
jgi:hypothetical protein